MNRGSSLVSLTVLLIGIAVLMGVADLGGGALNELLLHLPGVDKVLHVVLGMGVFLAVDRILRRAGAGSRTSIVGALVCAALVAILDEVQQQLVGGRSVEAADVAAGLAGAGVGIGWRLRAVRPPMALVVAACGVAAGAWLAYTSHLDTRDYNRGVLAERAGLRNEALEHYRAAAARGVRNPEVYNALAWMMLETGQGDPREAAGYAEHSLTLNPDNPDALDTYGWALVQAGRPREAVSVLERALASKPGIYCIHYHLGVAYLQSDRRADGLQHLRLQVERMPATREARLAAEVLSRFDSSVSQ